MTKKLHRFVITRSRWVNGSNNDNKGDGTKGTSALLNEDGNMCCLGFFAKSCGFKPREIKDMAAPNELFDLEIYIPEYVEITEEFEKKIQKRINKYKEKALNTPFKTLLTKTFNNSAACSKIMTINDDNQKLTPKKREQLLKKKFRSLGVIVEFK